MKNEEKDKDNVIHITYLNSHINNTESLPINNYIYTYIHIHIYIYTFN